MHTFRIIPILALILFQAVSSQCQQTPFLNFYTWNPRLFNPASQGANEMGELTAIYRSQFQSLDVADRPNTYLFHADFSPWFNERIGLATQVMGDKAHIFNRFQFSGFFGYHVVRNDRLRFSLGASVSFLSQNFDFEGLRLSDILDLSVFYGQMNTSRIDGGPGIALEYHLPSGSFFALDAAATQLFSSDIQIDGPDDSSQRAGIFDMIPHALANARFRYQGSGFSLEPNIAFRYLSGPRKLKYGVYDFNLNAYFLNDNRLMLGCGIRTDQGGYHFQLGVAPTAALRLIASAELHSQLGTSYEIGASYSFGKNVPELPAPLPEHPVVEQNILLDLEQEIQDIADRFDAQAQTLEGQYNIIQSEVTSQAAGTDRWKKSVAADSCVARLENIEHNLVPLRQLISTVEVKRLQAEQQVRTVTSQGGTPIAATLTSLKKIKDRSAELNSRMERLDAERQNILQQCENLRTVISEYNCIEDADADCISNLFNKALSAVPGKPENLYPLRIFSVPEAAAVTYHFPDDAENYTLSTGQKALANHLAMQIRQLEAQGVHLDNLTLVTELQEDRFTLGYRLNTLYGGEFGENPLPYTLVNHETGETESLFLTLPNGSPVSLEALGVLKLHALKRYFTEQGISPNLISLQVRYNHSTNIYREETKMVLRLRS